MSSSNTCSGISENDACIVLVSSWMSVGPATLHTVASAANTSAAMMAG